MSLVAKYLLHSNWWRGDTCFNNAGLLSHCMLLLIDHLHCLTYLYFTCLKYYIIAWGRLFMKYTSSESLNIDMYHYSSISGDNNSPAALETCPAPMQDIHTPFWITNYNILKAAGVGLIVPDFLTFAVDFKILQTCAISTCLTQSVSKQSTMIVLGAVFVNNFLPPLFCLRIPGTLSCITHWQAVSLMSAFIGLLPVLFDSSDVFMSSDVGCFICNSH